MRNPSHQYSVQFDFILRDEQRQHVEDVLQHDGIAGIRWEPHVAFLKINVVVVEFRLDRSGQEIGEAVTFVGCKLQCLRDSLRPAISV